MGLGYQAKPDRDAKGRRGGDKAATITIGEMSRAFDVSLRTLRFYEDRGLLVPRREGTARFYAERDKERLQSILQLKQLGFTLTEIRTMIADAGKRSNAKGVKLRADQVSAQLEHLERQRQEIEGAISALRSFQKSLDAA